jgi:hypothetical protein
MPTYYAGVVNANASVKFGTGFTVTRLNLTGSYVIAFTVPQTKFFAFAVTPAAVGRIARVLISRDATTGVYTNHVQIHDAAAPYNAVDGDFSFIAVERSGP